MRQPVGGPRPPAVNGARRLLTLLWAALVTVGVSISGAPLTAPQSPTPLTAGHGSSAARVSTARTETGRLPTTRPHRSTDVRLTDTQPGVGVLHAKRVGPAVIPHHGIPAQAAPVRVRRPRAGPPPLDTAEPKAAPGRAPPASISA